MRHFSLHHHPQQQQQHPPPQRHPPQQQQQHCHPWRMPIKGTRGRHCSSSVACAAVSSDLRPSSIEHEQPAQHAAEQLIDGAGSRRGRLLFKRPHSQHARMQQALPASLHELRGHTPRGTVSLQQQQQPALQQQQQHHQQQLGDPQQQQQQQQQQRPPWQAQSSRDKNLSFSGALRSCKTLQELLQLLQNPQWGVELEDLDVVSVVGALVWLLKSPEWQQLQHKGSKGQQQWREKQAGLKYIQVLMDRAEQLVFAQHSSSSNTQLNAAPTAASAPPLGPPPQLIRPAELCNLIYAVSKLEQQRPQLLSTAAAALQLDLYACSPTELGRLIWGLAAARVNPGDAWLLNFCKAAQAKLFACSVGQLVGIVYGVARLGYRPADVWIAAWLEASLPLLGVMNPQQLANTAWGLSCFRFQAPPGWLSAFYAATAPTLPQQAPTGISQLAIALVTLGGGQAPPQEWLQQLLAAAQPLLKRFELLQLCNLVQALAKWGVQPEEAWMVGWTEASLPLLPAATPLDLSVLLWSCYKLSYVPHQVWLEAWFASCTASLPRLEPLQLATTALVLGEWGLVPAPGFSIDFWRASKTQFPQFTPYQMSVMLWGFARARRALPTTWATALITNFTQQLSEADPGDVCRFIGALSWVSVKPRGSAHWVASTPAVQQQLQQMVLWLLPQLPELQPRWLLALMRGLVGVRCRLEPASIQSLNDAAAQLDQRLTPGQRTWVGKSFKILRQLAASSKEQQQQQQQGERQQQTPQADGGGWVPQQPVADMDW